MTNVLNSFEERLTKLEATILPVYQETENLQRRQENIAKTLKALDYAIDFYNVNKEVENVGKVGPSTARSKNILDNYMRKYGTYLPRLFNVVLECSLTDSPKMSNFTR